MTDSRLRGLVDRARQGDTEAFGELVDLHRQPVYRAALAALRSPVEAEDVAQEAFVAAFQKLDGFRGESTFKTWLLAIAWRKALDRRSTLSHRWRTVVTRGAGEEAPAASDPVETLPDGAPSPEDRFLRTELAAEIQRLIGTLPAKLRDALLLAGTGDYSYEEMAGMLDAPIGTIKWRVSEARRLLKQKLGRLGYHHD